MNDKDIILKAIHYIKQEYNEIGNDDKMFLLSILEQYKRGNSNE